MGCWQITSEKGSRLETALVTPDGVCEFNESREGISVQCLKKKQKNPLGSELGLR